MIGRLLLSLALPASSVGCVYLNGLYNGERVFAAAEKAHWSGRDSAAAAGWAEAERKAAASLAKEPQGRWAARSLYLLGRARLRRGDWSGAREALEPVREGAAEPALRAGATLYLGAVAVATGDPERAVHLLNEGIATVDGGRLRGEGHLWRARLYLALGAVDQGWWDLDRAAEADPSLAVPAAIERLTFGVAEGDSARAAEGARTLLLDPAAIGHADTLVALVGADETRRGPRAAAFLLASVDEPGVPAGAELDRALLMRAALHLRAADTARATADAARVAERPSTRADELRARLLLARLGLARATRVDALEAVRSVLLPVAGDPMAGRLHAAASQVLVLVDLAEQGQTLGLFAAGEVARDALDATALATALFLAYADGEPAGLWRGKALLAALEVAPAAEREPIRRRAAALAGDPYITTALGGITGQAAYEELERELGDQLGGLLAESVARVRTRDVLVRRPEDTSSVRR